MVKKSVPIYNCKIGDIVGRDIINENGVAILVENTILNQYIIDRLRSLGTKYITVYDREYCKTKAPVDSPEIEEFFEEYEQNICEMKSIFHDLALGKSLDVEKIMQISETIASRINLSGNIVKFLQLIETADRYTYAHSINTAFYAMLIGKWLKLSDKAIRKALLAGLLHDVGKARIPKEILNKEGALTKEEYEIIKQHTVYGYDIVLNCEDIDHDVKRAVLLHHERVDRSGYPFNTAPDCINLLAKIVAVADVYDAMTTDRVYKKRTTPFEVFRMFRTVGVSIFDNSVINTFLKHIVCYLIDADVLLSSGDIGKIVYIPPQDIACPILYINSEYIDMAQDSNLKLISMV